VLTLDLMAILTALLGFVGKKAGDLFQAVLGWSVTALFGRLPSTRQTALSVVFVASLLWPILVIGVFVPGVTAWMFAFLPVHKWIGAGVVRIISVVLAALLPAAIGLAVDRIVPHEARRGGTLRMLIGGYPLTLGFAIACLVTAVTVPIVKVLSAFKRWKDEHVYVQPMRGKYGDTVAELARAMKMAGVEPHVDEVPRVMTIGSRVLLRLARGTIDALVAESPKRVSGEHVELYLYAGDLLMRGEASRVARIHAKMNATALVTTSYLVGETASQRLQDRIASAWTVLDRPPTPEDADALSRGPVHEISRDLESAQIPFDEWAVLDREILRLERVIRERAAPPAGDNPLRDRGRSTNGAAAIGADARPVFGSSARTTRG
jgi:hypothetical protein